MCWRSLVILTENSRSPWLRTGTTQPPPELPACDGRRPRIPQAHDDVAPRRRLIPRAMLSLMRRNFSRVAVVSMHHPSTGRGRLRGCRQGHPQSVSTPICLPSFSSPCLVKPSFFILDRNSSKSMMKPRHESASSRTVLSLNLLAYDFVLLTRTNGK